MTKAACALHNYLRMSDIRNPAAARQYCPPGYVHHVDPLGNFVRGDWRSEAGQTAGLPFVTQEAIHSLDLLPGCETQ